MTKASTLMRAEAILPGVARLSVLDRTKAIGPWVLGFAAFFAILIDLDVTPATVFRGMGRLADFLGRMMPPSTGNDVWRIVDALVETFAMAFAGTALAVLAAIPLGLIGAKTIPSR